MISDWAMWGGFCTIDGELLIALGGKSGLSTVNGPCTSNKIAYLYGDALGFDVLHLDVEGHKPQTMCAFTGGVGLPLWGGGGVGLTRLPDRRKVLPIGSSGQSAVCN